MTRDDPSARDATPPDAAGQMLSEAMRAGQRYLAGQGIEDSATDSRRLLLHVTSLTPIDLVRDGTRAVTADEAARFADALARRATSEPVSRITGTRGFYGREFLVTPDTLDPRADTETLIEAALSLCRESGFDRRSIEIVDVGTGTGCILVTLLAELPLARGVGVDVSAAALDVARSNARRHGVGDRAEFVEGRGLAGRAAQADLVVSNPPYIANGDIAGLDRDVRDYDPRLALDGGPDGLDIYREIATGMAVRDVPGLAIFEVGAGQAQAVAGLLIQALGPLHADRRERSIRLFRDLGGVERCVAVSTQS